MHEPWDIMSSRGVVLIKESDFIIRNCGIVYPLQDWVITLVLVSEKDSAPLIHQMLKGIKGIASIYKPHSKGRCFQFAHYREVILVQVQCHRKEVLSRRSTTHIWNRGRKKKVDWRMRWTLQPNFLGKYKKISPVCYLNLKPPINNSALEGDGNHNKVNTLSKPLGCNDAISMHVAMARCSL